MTLPYTTLLSKLKKASNQHIITPEDAKAVYEPILQEHLGLVFAFEKKKIKQYEDTMYGDYAEGTLWNYLESNKLVGKSCPLAQTIMLRGDVMVMKDGQPTEIYLIAFLQTQPFYPTWDPYLPDLPEAIQQIALGITDAHTWAAGFHNLWVRAHIDGKGKKHRIDCWTFKPIKNNHTETSDG